MSKNFKKLYSVKYLLFYLPFVFVLGIVPLIVKIAVRENPLLGMDWYPQSQTVVDFFLYWKSVILIVSALMMLVLLVYLVNTKSFQLRKQEMILIPVVLLTFFEMMSSLLSENSKATLHGMPDHFETIWVMLAYSLCLIYAYVCLTRDVVKMETVTGIMLVSAFPIELICVAQFYKVDIFRYIYEGEGYTFTFEPGEVYGTFYNINYVGSYAILFIPCFITAAIYSKKIWIKVMAVIESIMLLISLYGSASATGVIVLAVILGIFVLVVLVRKIVGIKYRRLLFGLIAGLVCVAGAFVGKASIKNYLSACDTEIHDFDYVITGTNDIEFGYRGQVYHLSASYVDTVGLYIVLVDDDMNSIALYEMENENGIYYVSNESGLEDLEIRYILVSQNPDVHGVQLTSGDNSMYFSNEVADKDGYYYYSLAGVWTKITEENQSKSFAPLNKLSRLATGRGYIWNKTLAIMPRYFLFGSGADTFACAFPNDDYIDNMNNGYSGMIITKPHNMYLQYAVQSGGLSLLCLLVLFFWYIFKNFNLILLGDMNTFEERMNFALFLGLSGYMVTGLANDSTVTVAPVFWILLGMGIALMNIISKKIN